MKNSTNYRLNFKSRVIKIGAAAVLILSLFSRNATAQVFWTEAFQNSCASACLASTYTGPNGTWTLTATGTNSAQANEWFISGAECGNAAGVCGSVCGATDPSLHIGANDGFVLDNGASYDAGGICSFGICVLTDMRAESPTINCSGHTTITLAFDYIENGKLTTDDATLWYFDGTVWAQIDPMAKTLFGACSPQGKWTAFSIVLPASANNNPNVKIGFRWVNNDDGVGTDPSVAVDDITLSTVSTSNTITTGTITGSPFCACSTMNVPFTSTGTFTAGNIYTAQLSDAAGSFAAPTTIGTLASTANTGTIACTIPCATPAGTGYRIRVISSTPPVTGSDNGVNITINALPVATFSYTASPYCQSAANPSPTFSGGGIAGTFSSTAGLVFVSTSTGQVNLSASTPGTYTVTNSIAASGGCSAVSATSTITITALPVATFSYTASPYCQSAANPSPTFSGGGVAGTFSSTGGLVFVSTSTGQVNLSASTPGTYTVTNTIAASGGCSAVTATSSITINADQSAAFSYSGSTFCQSGTNPTPTITGTAGGTFTASPAGLVFVSASTGEINLASSALNTFTITYTTAGPCAATSTATVTITTAPTATFSYSGTPYCQNAVNPSPTFTAGASAGTFSSTGGLVFVSTSTGQVNLSASTPGTYTVTNTIAASGGCSAATATSTIVINAGQSAAFNYSGSTFCSSGTNPTPTITGTAGGTFTAAPAGLVFVSTSTGEINLASTALNTYMITYITPGPCADTSSVSVTITNAPSATFSYTGTPYCQNAANPSPTFGTGASAGTFTSTAGLVFVNASTGVINLVGSTPGTYTVTNTIAASGGCPAVSATSTITINPVPVVTVNSPVICSGQTATLTAGGATTYTWSAGATSTGVNTATASPAATTSYTVTGTSAGCTATAVATVTVNNCSIPVANFSGTPNVMCQAGCVAFTDLSTNSPTSWSWSFPGAIPATSTAQNPTNICYAANGSYDVTLIATNASGSDTLTQTGYIIVGAPVSVTISGNTVINACESTVLSANPTDGTYAWGPNTHLDCGNCQSATVKPSATQQYYVTYTSPQGCVASDTVTVTVENLFNYFMPTAFSPNGDGNNDVLLVRGRGIDYINLKIFDRIGEKVFETTDLDKGWDGKLHGLPMNDNEFVYKLEVTYCNGETVKEHGAITLVK